MARQETIVCILDDGTPNNGTVVATKATIQVAFGENFTAHVLVFTPQGTQIPATTQRVLTFGARRGPLPIGAPIFQHIAVVSPIGDGGWDCQIVPNDYALIPEGAGRFVFDAWLTDNSISPAPSNPVLPLTAFIVTPSAVSVTSPSTSPVPSQIIAYGLPPAGPSGGVLYTLGITGGVGQLAWAPLGALVNVTGPAGPTGPRGPTGPTGPAIFAAYAGVTSPIGVNFSSVSFTGAGITAAQGSTASQLIVGVPGIPPGAANQVLAGGTSATQFVEQWVNVKAFGARGDGVTDDVTAIQAAIDFLRDRGGVAFFPAGTYACSRQIALIDGAHSYANIKLLGVGYASQLKATTNIGNGGGTGLLYFHGATAYGLLNVGIDSLRISGFDEVSVPAGPLVSFSNTDGSFFVNSYLDTHPYEGVYWTDPSVDQNITVRNNAATHVGGWGATATNSPRSAYNINANNVTMIGNRSFQVGAAIEQTGAGGVITSNTFEYSGFNASGPTGVVYNVAMSMQSTQGAPRMLCQANTIRFGSTGINYANGSGEDILADNIIDNCNNGIVISNSASFVIVARNSFKDTISGSQGAAITHGSPVGAVIEDNVVTAGAVQWAYAILISSATAADIVRNNKVVGDAVSTAVFRAVPGNTSAQFLDNIVVPQTMATARARYQWQNASFSHDTFPGIDNATVFSTLRPSYVRGTSAPSIGTWSVGDYVDNIGHGATAIHHWEFLALGATGIWTPVNVQGITGPQGVQGVQGVTGATGPQGPTGSIGPAGGGGSSLIFVQGNAAGPTALSSAVIALSFTGAGYTAAIDGVTANQIDILFLPPVLLNPAAQQSGGANISGQFQSATGIIAPYHDAVGTLTLGGVTASAVTVGSSGMSGPNVFYGGATSATYVGGMPNAANAIGHLFTTPGYTTAGSQLAAWRSGAVSKAHIDKDGGLVSSVGWFGTVDNTSAGSGILLTSSSVRSFRGSDGAELPQLSLNSIDVPGNGPFLIGQGHAMAYGLGSSGMSGPNAIYAGATGMMLHSYATGPSAAAFVMSSRGTSGARLLSFVSGITGPEVASVDVFGNVKMSGFAPAYRQGASTVTVLNTDRFVGVTGTGARTVNLPLASTMKPGQELVIQDIANAAGAITINPALGVGGVSDGINGGTGAVTIAAAFGRKWFICDGATNYYTDVSAI